MKECAVIGQGGGPKGQTGTSVDPYQLFLQWKHLIFFFLFKAGEGSEPLVRIHSHK